MTRTRSGKTTAPPLKASKRPVAAHTMSATNGGLSMATTHSKVSTTPCNDGINDLAPAAITEVSNTLALPSAISATTTVDHPSLVDTSTSALTTGTAATADFHITTNTSQTEVSTGTAATMGIPTIDNSEPDASTSVASAMDLFATNNSAPEASVSAATTTDGTGGAIEEETLTQPSIWQAANTAVTNYPAPTTASAPNAVIATKQATPPMESLNTADTAPSSQLSEDAVETGSASIPEGSVLMTTTNGGGTSCVGSGSGRNQSGQTSTSQPLITRPNSPDDPILIDDELCDGPHPRSIKQLLQYRQRYAEKMDSILERLTSYYGSTADSDQSGDYGSAAVGDKRSFDDFLSDELDDSDQPEFLVSELYYEIEEYQEMLRRTKEFQRS